MAKSPVSLYHLYQSLSHHSRIQVGHTLSGDATLRPSFNVASQETIQGCWKGIDEEPVLWFATRGQDNVPTRFHKETVYKYSPQM